MTVLLILDFLTSYTSIEILYIHKMYDYENRIDKLISVPSFYMKNMLSFLSPISKFWHAILNVQFVIIGVMGDKLWLKITFSSSKKTDQHFNFVLS
jgi:hypothetical protein